LHLLLFQPHRSNDYTHRIPTGWLNTVDKIDQQWIGQTLFASKGVLVANLKTWWYPPTVPGPNWTTRPSPEAYFYRRFFLWMPRKMWAFDFKCPTCSDSQSLTSKGLYNRVLSVIDLTGRYYLGAEYLECRSCRGTFISYDTCLLGQLPDAYQVRFPVILTRKYACDRAVVNLMRARTLGNSPTAVCHDVHEMQTEDWMRSTITYLTDCERHKKSHRQLNLSVSEYQDPPDFKSPPNPKWFLATYIRDVWARLQWLKASATSVYGEVLKIDSTKKITRKLQVRFILIYLAKYINKILTTFVLG
jgi:hypothetical protein